MQAGWQSLFEKINLAIKRLERCFTILTPARRRRVRFEPVVFVIANCHSTRVLLYAASFQAGWKLEFKRSLDEVLAASREQTPKAVLVEKDNGVVKWDRYCAFFSGQAIPFIVLGNGMSDDAFLALLSAGGYTTCGELLSSRDIVTRVNWAESLVSAPQVPV